jgi:hypothetical protein
MTSIPRELALWGSLGVFLLLVFVAPSFILSGLKMQNEAAGVRLVFWKKMLLGIVGGLVGAVVAIAVYPLAESAWCRDMFAQGSYCDGQGPLIMGLTVPAFAIVGSCVSMLWTWCSLRIPANSPLASVFSFRGRNRALNVGLAAAVQLVYWAVFAWIVYGVSRSLL